MCNDSRLTVLCAAVFVRGLRDKNSVRRREDCGGGAGLERQQIVYILKLMGQVGLHFINI